MFSYREIDMNFKNTSSSGREAHKLADYGQWQCIDFVLFSFIPFRCQQNIIIGNTLVQFFNHLNCFFLIFISCSIMEYKVYDYSPIK